MRVQSIDKIINGATGAITVGIYNDHGGETLTLQVEGTASAFTMTVKGAVEKTITTKETLTGISANLSTVSSITAKGIYTYDIAGIGAVEIALTSVTGGNVTATARITKTAE